MRDARRFSLALALAVAAHLGALVAVRFAKPPAPGAPSLGDPVPFEIDLVEHDGVDLDTERDQARMGARQVDGSKADRSAITGRSAASTLRTATVPGARVLTNPLELGAPSADDSAAVAEAIDAQGAPPERDAQGLPKRLALDALGITGGIRDGHLGRAPAPLDHAAQAEARIEASITASLLDRDTKIGLHAAGPILNALRDLTGTSTTPPSSRAVFAAEVDAGGRLLGLSVLQSNSARPAWESVAHAARGRLAARLLRVPKTRRGLLFLIEVESREQMPSGADPGLGVSVAGIDVQRGKGDRSARIEILGPPKIVEKTVKVGEEEVRMPTLVLPLVSAAGDVSDIAAVARRVVYTRLVEQRPL